MSIFRCPKCGKLVAAIFPMHDCRPVKKPKPPKGFRIYLRGIGNGGYALKITHNGRVVAYPPDLTGSYDDCRLQAIAICEKQATNPLYLDATLPRA